MSIEKPNRSKTRWDKSNTSLKNYQTYINGKASADKFRLKMIDLLYILNFKGGNATISEDEGDINFENKLKEYSKILSRISQEFSTQRLVDLSDTDLEKLKDLADEFLGLGKKDKFPIDGFKFSF